MEFLEEGVRDIGLQEVSGSIEVGGERGQKKGKARWGGEGGEGEKAEIRGGGKGVDRLKGAGG